MALTCGQSSKKQTYTESGLLSCAIPAKTPAAQTPALTSLVLELASRELLNLSAFGEPRSSPAAPRSRDAIPHPAIAMKRAAAGPPGGAGGAARRRGGWRARDRRVGLRCGAGFCCGRGGARPRRPPVQRDSRQTRAERRAGRLPEPPCLCTPAARPAAGGTDSIDRAAHHQPGWQHVNNASRALERRGTERPVRALTTRV